MPRVEAREAEVLGSAVDRGEIDRVVKSRLAELRHCYERELSKDPDLSGKVGIRFVIAADGGVSSAAVGSSTMRAGAVGDCLAGRFLRMRFPPPRGGGVVVVSYPLVFRAAGR
ncbi:AgmX/PglI C-terminal domain-containing protein [Myxococcota bacterium]|nr:AgmX/PglI C-terminal domain-containing protein [Myxococcota bacterium]